MNNLTIEQKAELMDILLNDSVIKNRIDNILNSKTISTSIDEDNNIHFINNNKKTIVRILSLNEYDKYIINGNADGSITKNDNAVWNRPIFQRSYRTSDCGYQCTYTIFTISRNSTSTITDLLGEVLQNTSSNNHNAITDIKFELHNFNPPKSFGHDNRNLTSYTCSKNSTNMFFSMSCTASSSGYNTTVHLNCYVYSSFRPVFQIKDNDKSKDLFQ